MMRLWKGTNCTLVNCKYKIGINTTRQPSIKILNKCSCLRRHEMSPFTSTVGRDLIFLHLKRVFLRKSRPLCFPEPCFGFPTLVRTHATTHAQSRPFRSIIHPRFYKKAICKYFSKFTEKHLFRSLLFNKVQD